MSEELARALTSGETSVFPRETPEEQKAMRERWARETALENAIRLVTAASYGGTVSANNVVAVAEQFAAFVEGETK